MVSTKRVGESFLYLSAIKLFLVTMLAMNEERERNGITWFASSSSFVERPSRTRSHQTILAWCWRICLLIWYRSNSSTAFLLKLLYSFWIGVIFSFCTLSFFICTLLFYYLSNSMRPLYFFTFILLSVHRFISIMVLLNQYSLQDCRIISVHLCEYVSYCYISQEVRSDPIVLFFRIAPGS